MNKSILAMLVAELAMCCSANATAASATPTYIIRIPVVGMRSAGPAAPDYSTDPYFSSVTSLVHMDGVDGAAAFSDIKGNTITTFGTYVTSTTTKHAGTASGYSAGTGGFSVNSTKALGTGDFTIEGWVYPTSAYGGQILFDGRPSHGNGDYPCITFEYGNINYYVNFTYRIQGGAVPLNTWNHFAVSRVSGVTKLFLNGHQTGAAWTDATNYQGGDYSISGNRYFGNASWYVSGYMDDIRVTTGVGRYSTNFTAAPIFADK